MKVNISLEFMPGQDALANTFAVALIAALDNKKVRTTLVEVYDAETSGVFQRANAMLDSVKHLNALDVPTAVLWKGTFLTEVLELTSKTTIEKFRVDLSMGSLSHIHRAAEDQGIPPPDVIIVPIRPKEGDYVKVVTDAFTDLQPYTAKRWWKNGGLLLDEIMARPVDWCSSSPLIIPVDYSDADKAVEKVLGVIDDGLWDRVQDSGIKLTDSERFMGLTPLEVKVPKKLLTQVIHEAKVKNRSLDAHVSDIIKKHLLSDIIGPDKGD